MTDRDKTISPLAAPLAAPPGSPLRRRMTEDMTVRGFTPCTQRGYLAAVENFTAFLGRSPDRSDAQDLRRHQLHMRSNGASATSMNSAVSALRFFFGVTLGRGDAEDGMTTVREPRRLPVVLSPEEVARLSRGGAQFEVQSGAVAGLWGGPAGLGGGLAQSLGHRQQPHCDPRRTEHGTQGSLCHAV